MLFHRKKMLLWISALAVHVVLAGNPGDNEWLNLKEKALNRERKVIYNNDGCDALVYPPGKPASGEEFLALRNHFAIGTEVNSIFYCPVSSGFGYLTSRTKAGDQLLNSDPERLDTRRNITGDLLKMGTDPVKLTEEFCRKNGFEFFISLRVNDTHDYTHRPGHEHFLFPPFKQQHPEYLMGSYENRPRYAHWSAVDFTHRAVRERFTAIAEELINNYDIDGIELDFCRHLQYFKSVAFGAPARSEECEMITECMRKIHRTAEAAGRKRGRPVLIAVRVPDSTGYARDAGLDVEQWMKEKLFDIYIAGFYLRLNPWEYSRRLCDRNGVKFIASLDESRIRPTHPAFDRHSLEGYRAREAAALQAGADGLYYFNRNRGFLRNFRGNLDNIRFDDKNYFISYRDKHPDSYIPDGHKYQTLRPLSPQTPGLLSPGTPLEYLLEFGDDLSRPDVQDRKPQLTACLQTPLPPAAISLKINDREISGGESGPNGIISWPVPIDVPKPGLNKITFSLTGAPVPSSDKVILSGEKLLAGPDLLLWRRLYMPHSGEPARYEKIIDGAYRLADTGSGPKDMVNFLYPLPSLPDANLIVEFDLKLESSNAPLGAVIRLANGKHVEIITFQPDKIGFYFNNTAVPFQTTDQFHHYRVELSDKELTLYADGRKLCAVPLRMNVDNPDSRLKDFAYGLPLMDSQSILIGSLSGPGNGISLWKNILLSGGGQKMEITDFKLELTFPAVTALPEYRDLAPEWTVDFNPAAGVSPAGPIFVRGYSRGDASIKEEDGKRFFHLNHHRNGNYRLAPPCWSDPENRIFITEFRARISNVPTDKSGFLLVSAPRLPDGSVLLGALRLYDRKIVAPWGEIELPEGTGRQFHTFRLILNTDTSSGSLYMDGKLLGSGRIGSRKSDPLITFGAGSRTVGGEADLEYVHAAALKRKGK